MARRLFITTFCLFLVPLSIASADEPKLRWLKGNTHTHTTESDGDSSPTYVAQWYKDHGYDFLVLSDHNVLTDPETLQNIADENFLLIPGEEVSASHAKKPVHVNGLNIDELVEPISEREDIAATIQANVDAVREVNGVPHINHPNFRWAFNHLDLLKVKDYKLLEIFNAHPLVNNLGGSGRPGMEEIWDYLLTSGERVYGIAVDDAHHFQGEFSDSRANPGRGWIVVRAAELGADSIMKAIEDGDFYASTGVVLEDISTDADKFIITINQQKDFGYRTEFVGMGGEILEETEDNPAVYNIDGSETYVRAKVYDSNSGVAWVQPVFFPQEN